MRLTATPARAVDRAAIDAGPVAELLCALLLVLSIAGSLGRHDRSTIDVQLVRPCRERYEPLRVVVVEVLPGPEYRLNGVLVTRENLGARLREAYAARADRIVHVRGDPRVTYQQVITTMDLARGAGARVVLIRTRPSWTRRPCPLDPRYPAL